MRNFEAHTKEIREEMLKSLGVSSIEEIYSHVPKNIRVNELDLNKSLNEIQVKQEIKNLANKNKTDYVSFLGGGAYKRFIPACVSQISSRFEFNTAYTPYQPEVSQGTLQVIYEYQSMICNLTNMDVANASIYDAATSCAEAVLMATRITNRDKCLVSKNLNPEYVKVIETYCEAADIQIDYFDNCNGGQINVDAEYSCILVQTPNFYGEIEDIEQIKKDKGADEKTLLICCLDIVSLALLEPPACDIAVGDVQSLGNPMSYGGPHAGFLACLDKHKRQIPGRVVGMTVDADGNQAFTLTLQTREQHIRREKATSNICSNQALVALQATVYMTVMGKEGLKQVAYLSAKNAHALADCLKSKGIKVLNTNFFNEFTVEVENADKTLAKLKQNGILGGLKLDDKKILVCATELISDTNIKKYVETV